MASGCCPCPAATRGAHPQGQQTVPAVALAQNGRIFEDAQPCLWAGCSPAPGHLLCLRTGGQGKEGREEQAVLHAQTIPELPSAWARAAIAAEKPTGPSLEGMAMSQNCSADAPTQRRGQILFLVLLSVPLCRARGAYGCQDLVSVGP